MLVAASSSSRVSLRDPGATARRSVARRGCRCSSSTWRWPRRPNTRCDRQGLTAEIGEHLRFHVLDDALQSHRDFVGPSLAITSAKDPGLARAGVDRHEGHHIHSPRRDAEDAKPLRRERQACSAPRPPPAGPRCRRRPPCAGRLRMMPRRNCASTCRRTSSLQLVGIPSA